MKEKFNYGKNGPFYVLIENQNNTKSPSIKMITVEFQENNSEKEMLNNATV